MTASQKTGEAHIVPSVGCNCFPVHDKVDVGRRVPGRHCLPLQLAPHDTGNSAHVHWLHPGTDGHVVEGERGGACVGRDDGDERDSGGDGQHGDGETHRQCGPMAIRRPLLQAQDQQGADPCNAGEEQTPLE